MPRNSDLDARKLQETLGLGGVLSSTRKPRFNTRANVLAKVGNLELKSVVDEVVVNGQSARRHHEMELLDDKTRPLIGDIKFALVEEGAAKGVAITSTEKLFRAVVQLDQVPRGNFAVKPCDVARL